MRAQVDEIRIFEQVLNEKRDPRAVLKEAISNAHDARARNVDITLTRRSEREIDLVIHDDGEGLARDDIRRFFNLGFSQKGETADDGARYIGEKGLGSKLIFNSRAVTLRTRDANGARWSATLRDARAQLASGELPRYTIHEETGSRHDGTSVGIECYQTGGSSRPFEAEHLLPYLRWFTAAGQATRQLRGGAPRLRTRLHWVDFPRCPDQAELRGHEFPLDSAPGDAYAKTFDPFSFELRDQRGASLGRVEVAGVVLESEAHIIQNRSIRKPYKGFFFCKDDFAIRSANAEIAGGTGVWQNFHVMINCQALELGASREEFTNTGEGSTFGALVDAMREFLRCAVRGVPFAYRGTAIEKTHNSAGAAYLELQAKKRADRHRRQGEALALDLIGLSRRHKSKLKGAPRFEPEDEIGTLAWFQSIILDPRSRGRFELLHATRARGGTVILRERTKAGTSTYALSLTGNATDRNVNDAINMGLDGVIAWTYDGPPVQHAKVLVVRDLVHKFASKTAAGDSLQSATPPREP